MSDARLRDLLAALLYTSIRWRSLRRTEQIGRADPDFVGDEDRRPEPRRTWWVKTARPRWTGDYGLPGLVVDLAARHRTLPDVLLVAATGEVAPDEVQACADAAARCGIPQALVWTRRDIEARVKRDRPDLGFAYFGAPSVRSIRSSARAVHRRLEMKHRLLEALLVPPGERPPSTHPFDKFRYSHVIVRSISDESYPEETTGPGQRPGWYRLATYDMVHNGLEFLLGTEPVVLDRHGRWSRAPTREQRNPARHQVVRALRIGKVAYERILEFDVDGDEYCAVPHLYCDFSIGADPFVDVRFVVVDGAWDVRQANGRG